MSVLTRARAARLAVGLAAVAAVLAGLHSIAAAAWTLVVAATLLAGVHWAHEFDARVAAHGDRAWSTWLLLPSIGAIGATFLARETWSIWAVVALVVVAMPTIAVHAMFMGQRDKPRHLGGSGAPPEGSLRAIVAWLPLVTALAVLAILVVAAVADLVG